MISKSLRPKLNLSWLITSQNSPVPYWTFLTNPDTVTTAEPEASIYTLDGIVLCKANSNYNTPGADWDTEVAVYAVFAPGIGRCASHYATLYEASSIVKVPFYNMIDSLLNLWFAPYLYA